MKYLVVVAVAGCAETTTTCPIGSKLIVTHGEQGRAELCQDTDQTLANMPAPGRSLVQSGGLVQPPGLPGGIEGPFTAWYTSGTKEAHGTYRNVGERSVPEGLWAFWYPTGELEVVGHYHHGEPIGCFATWDEHGVRHTGMVTDAVLREQACSPPSDAELSALEGHAVVPAKGVWADAEIRAFAGPARFGVAAEGQISPDPSLQFAFTATARARFGRLRIGPSVGIRTSDAPGYLAYSGGVAVAWELPKPHPRVDAEVGVELGVERMQLTAQRAGLNGSTDLAFWSPLPAVQASLSLALTPEIEAVAGVRIDGVPARTVDQIDVYCVSFGSCAQYDDSWRIGALAAGATLGLRFLLH